MLKYIMFLNNYRFVWRLTQTIGFEYLIIITISLLGIWNYVWKPLLYLVVFNGLQHVMVINGVWLFSMVFNYLILQIINDL